VKFDLSSLLVFSTLQYQPLIIRACFSCERVEEAEQEYARALLCLAQSVTVNLHGQSGAGMLLSGSPGSTQHRREGMTEQRAWFHLLEHQLMGMIWVCIGAAE